MSGYDKGRYIGHVMEAGYDVVKKEGDWKGTPYLKVVFRVVAQFDNDEDDFLELSEDKQWIRNLTIWFGSKGKATDKDVKACVAKLRKYFDWEGEDLGQLENDLVGADFECVCKGQEDGYDRFDLPGGGALSAPKNEKVANTLKKRFNKLCKVERTDSAAGKNGKPKKANSETKPPKEEAVTTASSDADDDIPF